MVATLKTYIADLKETTAAKERIEGELAAARSIQMGMLPRDFVPDLPGMTCMRCWSRPRRSAATCLIFSCWMIIACSS